MFSPKKNKKIIDYESKPNDYLNKLYNQPNIVAKMMIEGMDSQDISGAQKGKLLIK